MLRLSAEELRLVGETIAKKLNRVTGPIRVLIPNKGFSSLDYERRVFYDPQANKGFIDSLVNKANETVKVLQIDVHINDNAFAKAVFDEFMKIIEPTDF